MEGVGYPEHLNQLWLSAIRCSFSYTDDPTSAWFLGTDGLLPFEIEVTPLYPQMYCVLLWFCFIF